jgi:wyosine [tRNA(Phe)-imidazoG37] synthetase (radical SAM superfamily)
MICFGPVPSRRLGKSLGINNLTPPKTCSFGCVYCQLGRTVHKTTKRTDFYKPDYLYDNVCQHLDKISKDDYPDYLTLVSNGEPTLDVSLGKIILKLKELKTRIAVITNSSLLFDKSVQEDLSGADIVSVKIDTVYAETWEKMNNPAKDLNPEKHFYGITDFTTHYHGTLISETMLISGLNDSEEEIQGVTDFISGINPEKAFISIPIRPPAGKWVRSPDPETMNKAWQIFNSAGLNAELLTGFEGTGTGFTGNIYEDILNITAVHPLREDSLRMLLENDGADFYVVESLISQHLIKFSTYNGIRYYIRNYHS